MGAISASMCCEGVSCRRELCGSIGHVAALGMLEAALGGAGSFLRSSLRLSPSLTPSSLLSIQ